MVEPSGIEVVRDPGATSWCKGRRSPAELRISKRKMVEPSGIEPLTSCVQGRRSPS